jgi:hypothetical protein
MSVPPAHLVPPSSIDPPAWPLARAASFRLLSAPGHDRAPDRSGNAISIRHPPGTVRPAAPFAGLSTSATRATSWLQAWHRSMRGTVPRLPPLDRCDPEAFHVAKPDLAPDVRAVATDAKRGGSSDPASASAACAATTRSRPSRLARYSASSAVVSASDSTVSGSKVPCTDATRHSW